MPTSPVAPATTIFSRFSTPVTIAHPNLAEGDGRRSLVSWTFVALGESFAVSVLFVAAPERDSVLECAARTRNYRASNYAIRSVSI